MDATIARRAARASFAILDCLPSENTPASRSTDPLCQGEGSQTGIGPRPDRPLLSKLPEQSFRPENSRELGTNATDVEQAWAGRRRARLRFSWSRGRPRPSRTSSNRLDLSPTAKSSRSSFPADSAALSKRRQGAAHRRFRSSSEPLAPVLGEAVS